MRLQYAILAGALAGAPLAAQQTPPDISGMSTWEKVQMIMNIPKKADEVRRAGVPDTTVRSVLEILTREKVPPQEAVEILETERAAAEEHGPTDNFGAFVQSQLAAGKRGRDLAAAIRAEHQARGKGKPAGVGARGGRPEDDGRGGRPEARGGRPDDVGGRPDAAMNKGGKAERDTTRGKRPEAPGKSKRPF